ncbi:hypothetical protein [Flavobacterium antarcticum]|uniref:hypothetical protein n=1 Tax=Flavobacterium antarcticum TaxID=271155 RepID=UPI0003B40F9D|nr:hypothetical protein [Flavobacterium antarcticum]
MEEDIKIIVLQKYDILPLNSNLIEDLKIGDSGFTLNCGYNKVLAYAKTAAKNSGANILQII